MIGAIIVAIFFILGPPAIRTINLAQSADGLLLLASFSDSDFDWNPWSQDCYFIHQGGAVWLLSDFDWPYTRRSGLFLDYEPTPLVNAALSSRGLGDKSVDDRMLLLMDVFVSKGESVDERWEGYTPVQAAILQRDREAVEFLVDRGADLDAVIDRPGKEMDGMNSIEFVDFLHSKHPEQFKPLRHYLIQHNGGV
jgi:hypothetical protein